MLPLDLTEKFALITEHWRPKVVAELNGQEVKVVKCQGVFPWHHHEKEDELFLVWRGKFRVEFRDRVVELTPGQMCVVPRGVEHRTAADEEAEVIIFEPAAVLNTGNVTDATFTAPDGREDLTVSRAGFLQSREKDGGPYDTALDWAVMSNVTHLWAIYLGTLIGLLPIINPAVSGPDFLAMTEGDSPDWRRKQAVRGCFYMIAILVSFLVAGTYIMNFFGISIPGLRIAGGILLTGIAMKMLSSPKEADKAEDDEVHKAAKKKVDISFSPLAMPMLSGPGSIAVTLGLTSLAKEWVDYFAIIGGIITVAIITYIVLRLSTRLVKIIGPVGVSAMTKIMGFLLMAMGVQFVVNGLLGIATDPEMIRMFKSAIASS